MMHSYTGQESDCGPGGAGSGIAGGSLVVVEREVVSCTICYTAMDFVHPAVLFALQAYPAPGASVVQASVAANTRTFGCHRYGLDSPAVQEHDLNILSVGAGFHPRVSSVQATIWITPTFNAIFHTD